LLVQAGKPLPVRRLSFQEFNMTDRRTRSRALREQTALTAFNRQHSAQLPSGEEAAYVYNGGLSYAGSFTKGLPHDAQTGLADGDAFRALVHAITTTRDSDYSLVPFGAPEASSRRWVNPTAGAAFDMEGPDAGSLSIPPAPQLTSPELAAEMAELYWMALLRDHKFSQIEAGTDAKVVAAVASLNQFDWFGKASLPIGADRKRPAVTPQNLFRGVTAGDEIGPYVSQFLLMGTNALPNRGQPPVLADFQSGKVLYGAVTIDQRITPALTRRDYMTAWDQWLAIQNGANPANPDMFEAARFIATPRDLATYVHYDALYEAYLNACLILLEIGAKSDPGLPFADGKSRRQDGFGVFGPTHVLTLVTEVATRALKCVWRQKWMVHRRARPEAVAGLIENYRRKLPPPQGAVPFVKPLVDKLKAAQVLQQVEQHRPNGPTPQGTHLLPMAFPEGSPMHPAYGAGHATVAGACVTVLKAFFDERHKLPFAFQANPTDPTKLQRLSALNNTLTVGGELNKLASNISVGRNMAGVHYFTDYIESIRLGEQIACAILEEQAVCYPEDFSMTFTSFDRAADGSPIDVTIEKNGDTVVKREQVRQTPSAAGATVMPIAAE
jgi:hypothetical protein